MPSLACRRSSPDSPSAAVNSPASHQILTRLACAGVTLLKICSRMAGIRIARLIAPTQSSICLLTFLQIFLYLLLSQGSIIDLPVVHLEQSFGFFSMYDPLTPADLPVLSRLAVLYRVSEGEERMPPRDTHVSRFLSSPSRMLIRLQRD